MREINYSPPLDGLRAICIIFTLFYHIDGVPHYINGSVGVDVFFPLSGFLITGILLRSDWRDLKGYYIRRFYRIVPVYYLGLLLTALAAIAAHYLSIGESKLEQLETVFIPSILFSRELVSTPTLFAQAWTIGIEEKFYILWPVIFLFLGNNRNRIAMLVVVFFVLLGANSSMMLRGYGGIALGCISAILFLKNGFYVRTGIAVIILLFSYAFCIYSELWFKNISISIASALLIPSLFASKSIISRALSQRIIVFLGRLTFSIYIFHVLIFYFVKLVFKHFGIESWVGVFLTGYILTILFSWLVYRFYESPLIKYGKRITAS